MRAVPYPLAVCESFPDEKTPYPARSWLLIALCLSLLATASGCLIDQIGGASSKSPEALEQSAGDATKKLVAQAYDGIDPSKLVDHHTHLLAIGTTAKQAFVNPKMRAGISLERLKFLIYESASGIKRIQDADREYVARLVSLARSGKRHGKFRVLAFDKHYNGDGSVNLAKTNMYVPNDYVIDLSKQYSDVFLPVISVQPYRPDALQELEKWGKMGVKFVKWLPNAMGIDPASPAIEPYYRKMKEHNMILLSHAGEEQAVEAEEDQRLGNPLLLRKPLDMGLRVVVAHGASLGTCDDLDRGQGNTADCFDLFLRLMDERKYVGLLFGEISAMLQFNRMPRPFTTILERQDLHQRLVNGSDYPLPAINALIWTRSFVRSGFITAEERRALNEIYDYNPLLFDFVLKRTMRHPETKQKLAPSVFMANPGLE